MRSVSCGRRWRFRSRLMAARARGPVLAMAARARSVSASRSCVRDDLADQPHGQGFVRRRSVGGEEQVARPGQPDHVSQPGRHERIGDAAQQFRHAEAGLIRGDDDVAMQHQIHAAGDAQAIHLRDPQLVAPLDVAEREVVGADPIPPATPRHPRRCPPCRRRRRTTGRFRSGRRRRARAPIRPDRSPFQPAVHVLGVGVAPLRAVDPKVQHAVLHLGDEEPASQIRRASSSPVMRAGRAWPRCRAAPCG